MTPEEERAYELGSQAAWTRVMGLACAELMPQPMTLARLLKEMGETRLALVAMANRLGYDVPRDLHMADILEKYIRPHVLEVDT